MGNTMDNNHMAHNDHIVRATACDGLIRAFAASTKNLVEQARIYHNTSPVATAALGRLLTAGSMMGIMMKGENDLLTLSIKGTGPIGAVTVTADSSGYVKGYVNEPCVILPSNDKGKLDVSGAIGAGTLSVIKDIGLKEPYTGQIELVSGEIAEDLTYYFAASEQIPSSVALGVLMNGNDAPEDKINTVRHAGGFIIQLMPDVTEDVISELESRLGNIKPVTTMLAAGMSPYDILSDILSGMGLNVSGYSECGYRCNCSRKRVEKALISIGEKELESLIADGSPIEIGCQFCNAKYTFDIDELVRIKESAIHQAGEDLRASLE